MTEERESLRSGIKLLGLSATVGQENQLLAYLAELEEANRSFNLTRIARDEFVTLHLLDSLAALRALPDSPNLRVLDIGTGAGFPGVPIAALLPGSSVTLLDSTGKKVRFAAAAAQKSGLANVLGIHGRAEMLGQTEGYRESFDAVTSRAVAPFGTLVEWMLPLVRIGGVAVALKGTGYREEMEGCEALVSRLGGGKPQVHSLLLPNTGIERFVISIPKVASTPKTFPRSK